MEKKTQLVHLKDGTSLLVPFILITSLFFLWGFAHSILDVLNKHFQDALGITKTKSALVQAVVYGGYFLMALPAGAIIRRWGYRTGVLTGLLLYGTGALLFIPGSSLQSFGFFLFSLFVIGCGLTCLETAANPYVTVLGEPAAAERRINLAQSFNGLGWICGPLVGGFFLFAENSESNISLPYAIIGIVVLLVAVVFSRVRLPEITAHADTPKTAQPNKTKSTSLWKASNAFPLCSGTDRYQQLLYQLCDRAGRNIGPRSIHLAVVRRHGTLHAGTHGRKLADGIPAAGEITGSLCRRCYHSDAGSNLPVRKHGTVRVLSLFPV